MAAHHVTDYMDLPVEVLEADVLFETSHAIHPSKEELQKAKRCPRCGSTKCELTLYGTNTHSFIRGYGWRDKEGAKRDMNLYTLANDDPYADYRVPGEVDHIKTELKKKGKHNPKPQHFVGPPISASDVKRVTSGG